MLQALASLRITVICLFLLFVLTFWGTIAQVHQGLYGAQERFFNSFFFMAGGVVPFPGAQLVLWVLVVNLGCMTVLTFKKFLQWRNFGLLITHCGILVYLVAAFMVFHLSKESYVHLTNGQSTNLSTSYHDWELSYWQGGDTHPSVTAVDAAFFKPGLEVPLHRPEFKLRVKAFYPNSEAFGAGVNVSELQPKPVSKEKEQNVAGAVFELEADGQTSTLMLTGAVDDPRVIQIGGQTHNFILRHKKFPLPFTITLDEFKAEFLPGTEMAKNYESRVTIKNGTLERQARIFMNNPLRFKDFTLYQSSYQTDRSGRMYSTLAVVQNGAKYMPYWGCLIVFVGLAMHFLVQAFLAKERS